MPSFEHHCKSSLLSFGNEFCEVHAWLDEFFKLKGPSHRKIRHHREGIEQVRKTWGDMAANAAKLHISEDLFGLPIPNEIDYIGGDGSWPVGPKWNEENGKLILPEEKG